jgi:hypothetical protein
MRKLTIFCSLFLVALICGNSAVTQQASSQTEQAKTTEPPAHYYHLDLVVQELSGDAKPVNSRSYSLTVGTAREDRVVSMRTGSRIPVPTGASNPAGTPASFQYMDVGVNFDVSDVREFGGKLAINLTADVSSLATEVRPNALNAPIVRNNRWRSPVLLPLNKQTVVFTSDALDTKGSMQVLVTATPLQ